MRYDLWTKELAAQAVDCVAIGVYEEGELEGSAAKLDHQARRRMSQLIARGDFSGRAGETLLLLDVPGVRAPRVLLAGLGPRKTASRRSWRRAIGAAIGALARTRVRSTAIAIEPPAGSGLDSYLLARSVTELTAASLYRVNDLKTGKKPKPPALERVLIGPVPAGEAAGARRGLTHGAAIGAALRVHRDLANLPANVCTPGYLGRRAKEIADAHASLRARVLDETDMRRLRMGCLLAVTRGSQQPPRFIVVEHRGGRAGAKPVVLVGKGVTFDTGGISLKDPQAMDEMKFDMSGAASVLAALTLAAELKLPLHVVGLVPACENMPGGRAIKPGDIVTSAAGQTVEILNTDAEGRLILCDALNYARRYEPAAVVDIATLTGACVVALGAHHTGLVANDDALAQELLEAGRRADDRAWQLPLTEEYGEQLKSNFADVANVGGREAGAITAAAFLGRFTEGLAWAHLDIAGTAYLSGTQKGSTGRPVPLLADFLIARAGQLP
ncbi:MAG: leucyl aminopeptidase [Gammaproteobacteria bacterium]|nr:leucyl aminopeptidase [Gammaproteobacteria bacterium]